MSEAMSAPAASGGHPGSAPAGTALEDAAESWPVESATEVFRNWLIGVRNDEVRMPAGRVAQRSVVTHPGAVSVLALDDAVSAILAGKLHNGHTIAGLLAGHAARSLGFSGLRPAGAPELPDLPDLPGLQPGDSGKD